MKKMMVIWLLCACSAWAQDKTAPPSFNFNQVNVSQVINLIYGEALKTNFVIDPEVLTDQRQVSFRYKGSDGAFKPFVSAFLRSLGYEIETKAGVDYIQKTKTVEPPKLDDEIWVYRPKYREAGYLTRILRSLFKGKFSVDRPLDVPQVAAVTKDVPNTSAAGQIQQDADVIVFSGAAGEVTKLEKLMAQIDLPRGQVSVRAAVYEVSSTKSDGSAFQALVKLLNAKVGISINANATNLGNAINLNTNSFQAIVTAIDSDSRFKSISQPRLRVRSGDTSKLVVGQDVPIVGSVTYQQGGNAVQSVQYQSAGTILTITPTVRDDSIDVKVLQQISNFVATTTGVNQSPTLIKRELDTTISAQSGDVIVLGGLKWTQVSRHFLSQFKLHSSTHSWTALPRFSLGLWSSF